MMDINIPSNYNNCMLMLIGVAGSGKSTWANENGFTLVDSNWMHMSTDVYIEQFARTMGKTYSDVFASVIVDAERDAAKALQYAIETEMNICWDQTNLTPRARAKKLLKIPASYYKIAVVFPTPGDHALRLGNPDREGKVIPQNVITGMVNSLTYPTLEEGFQAIMYVDNASRSMEHGK